MAFYLVNAFSLNMLPATWQGRIETGPLTVLEAAEKAAGRYNGGSPYINGVGHADTDTLVLSQLNAALAADWESKSLVGHIPTGERLTISLQEGDSLIVAQYSGPRLPEGATQLPEEAAIFYRWIEFPKFRTGLSGAIEFRR